MIRLAIENTPASVAWAAFDAAAIRYHRGYAAVGESTDTEEARARRMKDAEELVRLWDEWRALFDAENEPKPAA